ncbi:MAG: CBS domain-containing protein [Rikenellaceae bacterium]
MVSYSAHSLPIFLVFLIILAALSYSSLLLFSLSISQREVLESSENILDRIVSRLLELDDKLHLTLFTIKIFTFTTLVLVGDGLFSALYSEYLGGITLFFAKLLTILLIILIFYEVIPRLIFKGVTLRIIRFVGYPIYIGFIILSPITYIPLLIGRKFSSFGAFKNDPLLLGELSAVINESEDAESSDNRRIFNGIVRFVATEVADIMTPRVDLVAIEIGSSFEDVIDIIVESGFSRLPVYEDKIDNIKGVLYAKDIIAHVDDDDFKWQTTLRKPYFIPENKMINDLLQEFQSRRVHLALVVNEYGSLEGVISLEDILEEIVGEISDESDKENRLPYTKISENEYIFDAKIQINDFQKIFNLTEDYFDDYRGDAESIAGMMLEVKGDFISDGERQTLRDFEFIAILLSERRVEKIKVIRIEEQTDDK